MNSHEYADLFPMMSDSELNDLSKDIKQNGLQNDIITYEGKILDGRNRYKACEIAGVNPVMSEYEGEDALAFVISHNLHRRHLNESQRAMVASRMAKLKSGNPTGKNQHGTPPIGEVPKDFSLSHQDRKSVADKLQVGTSSLDRARRVQRDGADEVVDAVDRGEIRVSTAEELVKLPKEEQREVLAQGTQAVKEKVAEIRRTPKEVPQAEPESPTEEKPKYHRSITLDARGEPLHKIGTMMRMQAMTCMQRILDEDGEFESAFTKMRDYCNSRLAENKRTKELAY